MAGEVSVAIVDSALRSQGGHNFAYTVAVAEALERRGAHVKVLANRKLPPEIGRSFRRTFTQGAYDFPPGRGLLGDLVYIRRQAKEHASELADALGPEAPDLVFCHTVADFELQAWADHVERRPFNGTLVIVQRQTPGFRRVGRLRLALHPYWRLKPASLGRMRRRLGDRFVLGTDSESLSADYRAVFGGPILTLPIPVASQVAALPGATGRPIHLGYLGDARAPKGFDLLPPALEATFEAHAPVRALVQCSWPASAREPAVATPASTALDKLAERYPGRLELFRDALTPSEYVTLLGRMDVVLLPYNHPTYREATSGIFAEAVAAGRPVVVPSGTWMESELARAGAGVTFRMGDAADLGRATREAISRFAELAAAADQTRASWSAFHSADNLAHMLLDQVPGSRRARITA